MDSLPNPPDDPELKNIIDKLANFVARNGPEFEKMTKHKQMNNPKFNFLYGGEYFNYYQCKVATEQQIIRQRKEKLAHQQAIIQDVITQQSIQSAPWQQQGPPQHPPPSMAPPPQMQQPPQTIPTIGSSPWQQHHPPQQHPPQQQQGQPQMPPPPQQQQLPHNVVSLEQQQQQLQMQQQQLQQQLHVEKEKQVQLLKEQRDKQDRLQKEQQVQREREHMQEQIKESEENLRKQHEVFVSQQQEQIELGLVTAREEKIKMSAKELDVDLSELEVRLQAIIESCTKDAIANGKQWIFSMAKTEEHCKLITLYILHKIIPKDTPFETKLHLIYLINDVNHHCVRRGSEELQTALGNIVAPTFCSTYLSADDGEKQKLNKVLHLWESNNYFDASVMKELKTPQESLAAFQANQLEEFADVVGNITENIQEQMSSLQKQHQEFVDHVTSMLRLLDAQQEKAMVEEDGSDSKDTQKSEDVDTPSSSQQLPDVGKAPPAIPGGVNMPPAMANIPMMGGPGMPRIKPPAGSAVPPGPGMPPVAGLPQAPLDTSAMANMFPNFDPSVPPPGFVGIPRPPFQPGLPPSFPPPQPGMPPLHMMPPPNPHGQLPPMPDFSKPPPGFMDFPPDFNRPPPEMELQPLDPNDPSLMPMVPYFDLPAGLMAPLVKLEDTEYEPLDPDMIRLPPPQPPSNRLLAAVEAFYAPPSREAPRNSEGWEQNGLFEFFKAKQKYSKLKKERLEREGLQRKVHIPSPRRDSSSSRSPSPQREEESTRTRRRYRSRSRSASPGRSKSPARRRRSHSRSRSRSPPVYRRRSTSESPPPRRRNRSRSRSRSRSRTPPPRRRREKTRSPSPDYGVQPFYQTNVNTRLGEENKGAQLMKKMGWGGQGLGAREQGIVDPVSGGEVRDKMDMYRGVGVEINDPFESFRKNKSSSFMTRMKSRAAKSGK